MQRQIPFVERFQPKSPNGRVLIYRNLNKRRDDGRPVWSVRDAKTGLVIAHTLEIEVTDARFKVSAAGNARVRREKKKTVHAFVSGIPVAVSSASMNEAAYYNPYVTTEFVNKRTQKSLKSAARARVNSDGVHYTEA